MRDKAIEPVTSLQIGYPDSRGIATGSVVPRLTSAKALERDPELRCPPLTLRSQPKVRLTLRDGYRRAGWVPSTDEAQGGHAHHFSDRAASVVDVRGSQPPIER